MWLGLILLLGAFSYLLAQATEIVTASLTKLARVTKLGKFGLTAFILALATSLPELFVGISSAIEGRPQLALGNVMGSNVANLTMVMGIASLLSGSVGVVGTLLKRDLGYTLLIGCLPLLLLWDGVLGAVDGLVLLAAYGFFNFTVLGGRGGTYVLIDGKKTIFWRRLLIRFKGKGVEKNIGWLFFGIMLMILAADMMVRVGMTLAEMLQVPVILVGLFMLALGTTLPELAFEIKAIRQKQAGMVYGNLLGSLVANSSLILGVTALIKPIVITQGARAYLLATIVFLVSFGAFWFFVRTKRRLERWEGAFLVLIYILFIIVELVKFDGRLF